MAYEPPAWHSRGYLPHFDDGHAIQAVTYRLADSLPADVLARLAACAQDDAAYRQHVEDSLNKGLGSCILRDGANAACVVDTWERMNGVRYRLYAWVVMPNHVHVLLQPHAPHTIGAIIGSWKSITSRAMLLRPEAAEGGRAPRSNRRVWQADYHDRFIRNEAHFRAAVQYIHDNPVKARLVTDSATWPWSSANPRFAQRVSPLEHNGHR